MKQYAEGRVFVGGVIDLVGMEGFNRVWEGPANLPRIEELTAPGALGGAGASAARPSPPEPARTAWPAPTRRSRRSAAPSGPACAPPTQPVLVACSGGADSLALAAAARLRGAAAPGCRPAAVTVDHGLQPGSAERADGDRGRCCATSGSTRSLVVRVDVGADGGPEGAARAARYAALARRPRGARRPRRPRAHPGRPGRDRAARARPRVRARGRSPAWSSTGRPAGSTWWRPLLGVRRDDHPRGLRRPGAAGLGRPVERRPGLHAGAAAHRGAAAARGRPRRRRRPRAGPHRRAAARGPRRPRRRSPRPTLRPPRTSDAAGWPTSPGCPPRCAAGCCAAGCATRGVPDLQAVHLAAVDALLTRWRGQGRVDLPGGAGVVRTSGRLVLLPPDAPAARTATHPTIPRSLIRERAGDAPPGRSAPTTATARTSTTSC